MFENYTGMNTGTRFIGFVLMGNEFVQIIYDARWLLAVITLCVADYIIWVSLGVFTGFALLRPLGADYMLGGIAATAIAIGCEAKSFIGHFFYLHGIRIEQKSVTGFLRAFVVAFAKRKNADVGEALEDALEDKSEK